MVPVSDPGLQAQTLQAFTVFHALRPAWGGALVLNVGLDQAGSAVALASNAAGAVCLTLEPDPDRVRASLRTGASDFAVNTLDEALRAIKNEIRQKRPLSVGLEGSAAQLLDELLERGVAPQLFTGPDTFPEHACGFASFGARLLSFRSAEAAGLMEQVIKVSAAESTHATPWTLQTFAFASGRALRDFDARILTVIGETDSLRGQWLSAASRLFPRERTRSFWLSAREREFLGGEAAKTLPSRGETLAG